MWRQALSADEATDYLSAEEIAFYLSVDPAKVRSRLTAIVRGDRAEVRVYFRPFQGPDGLPVPRKTYHVEDLLRAAIKHDWGALVNAQEELLEHRGRGIPPGLNPDPAPPPARREDLTWKDENNMADWSLWK